MEKDFTKRFYNLEFRVNKIEEKLNNMNGRINRLVRVLQELGFK